MLVFVLFLLLGMYVKAPIIYFVLVALFGALKLTSGLLNIVKAYDDMSKKGVK